MWWKLARMPVRAPKSATCEASAGIRPWSSSAVGRSWRASVEQLLHRLRDELLGLLQLGPQRPRRVADRRRQPQQDRRQRLVDLVVQVLGDPRALLLLRPQHRAAGLAPLRLEPLEHPVERVGELVDLLAPRAWAPRRARPGARGRPRTSRGTTRSIGSSRARSSSELSRIALVTVSPSTSRPSPSATSASRSRETIAAISAVTPTRRALTARTCVRSVLRRIGTVRSSSAEWGRMLMRGTPHPELYFLKY